MRTRSIFAWFLTLVPLLLVSPACDPCTGVVSCGATEVRYEGEITLRFTGEPAEDIRVDFIRTGGARIAQTDTLTVRTDSEGRFRLQVSPLEPGEVIGTLEIHPPATVAPVRIEGVRLAPTRAQGDVRHLGNWDVPHRHFGTVGELYHRATNQLASGVEVEFRRTGGIRVEPERYVVTTDRWGRFPLMPRPLEDGEVIAELIVRPPAPARSFTIPDLRLSTRMTANPNPLAGRWGVGPHLPYAGLLTLEGIGQSAADIEVEVRRTGGISVEPERFVTRTNAAGTFPLGAAPLAHGEVVVEIEVRPPAPYRSFTVPGIRLQTTEEDVQGVLVGQWVVPRS